MKKRLLFIWTFLLCIVGGMSATEMTQVITFKETGTTSDSSIKQTTIEEIIASGSEYVSAITEATNVYNGRTGRGLKLGTGSKSAKLVMTLANPVKPTKITFTAMWYKAGEQSITVNEKDFTELTSDMTEYTVSYDGNTDVSEITISTPAKRAYIKDMTIYYEGEAPAVAAPVISGTTPFFGSTTVTIDCATEEASVYYTTDGTTPPTAESTLYTEPFTVEATTTVNAIAINGDDASTVASKTFEAIPAVADIATLNGLAKDAVFGFTGDAVVVANPNNKHVYIKDNTGSSLIFDAAGSITLAAGSHITPNWTGKADIYNGLFEVVPTSTLTAVEGTPDEIKYDVVTAADITEANVNRVVMLKGVTYTAPAEDKKDFTITAGDVTVNGYNQFGSKIDAPVEGNLYDIVGAIGIYSKNETKTIQFQPITITRAPKVVPVTVEAATGADLTALVNTEKTKITDGGDKVGDITVNLAAGGTYTVSGSIEAPASIIINGDATAPATIDASALAVPFVTLSATPSVEEINSYFRVETVKIANVKVDGIKNSIFYDNNTKYCVVDFTIDNAVLNLATEAAQNEALIAFQAGGAKDVNITNSTIHGNNAVAKYFIRYNNSARLDRYGFDKDTEFQTMNYQNNTFYGLLKSDGQWGNYGALSGQKFIKFDVQKNIWYNCGKEIIRRMAAGRFNGSNPMTFASNTYFNEGVDESAGETGYDKSGTILVTDPTFTDAANANFTIHAGSQQAKEQTGDPRWLVEYDAAQALAVPVTIAPATGADITVALNEAKAKVDKVGDVTINLAADGAYTVSGTLEAPASIVINGGKATIDASALADPFIALSATPNVEAINDYFRVETVKIANVKVNGIKNSIFYDNNTKYCVVDFTIDNAVLNLATETAQNEALIAFQAGGAKDVNITNSTIHGNNAVAKYFIRYNNSARLDRYGFNKETEFQTMNYQNNTFYGLLKSDGQWANYGALSGQKFVKFDVQKNIWYNCGKEIIRRMAAGRFNGSNPMTFASNTYFNEGVDESAGETGYDKSGTILVTDPKFADAANADFTIGASTQQAKEQTGDPRWLTTYVVEDVTDAKAELLAEIENATTLLGNADPATDEAAKALKDAIDKAQDVHNTAEFNEILKAATEELKAAEDAYRTATGINEITTGADADNGAWYNLQGVRIEKPAQKGIYIHNGRKVVKK